MTSSVPPVSDAGSVLVRAASSLVDEADNLRLRCTYLDRNSGKWLWPERCWHEQERCEEYELLARQLRALAEERRLGPREG